MTFFSTMDFMNKDLLCSFTIIVLGPIFSLGMRLLCFIQVSFGGWPAQSYSDHEAWPRTTSSKETPLTLTRGIDTFLDT